MIDSHIRVMQIYFATNYIKTIKKIVKNYSIFSLLSENSIFHLIHWFEVHSKNLSSSNIVFFLIDVVSLKNT